jgi:hypothetical protein
MDVTRLLANGTMPVLLWDVCRRMGAARIRKCVVQFKLGPIHPRLPASAVSLVGIPPIGSINRANRCALAFEGFLDSAGNSIRGTYITGAQLTGRMEPSLSNGLTPRMQESA